MKQRAEQHFFESAGGKAGEVVGGGHPGVFHRPFNEASINQIIKEAGIPRGSFYMYFQDKEDLFRYLLKGYVDQLFMLLEEFLLRNGGDIFRRCWICMITCRQKSTISTWERSAP